MMLRPTAATPSQGHQCSACCAHCDVDFVSAMLPAAMARFKAKAQCRAAMTIESLHQKEREVCRPPVRLKPV